MNSQKKITNKIKNKIDNSTNSLVNKTNKTYIYDLKKSMLEKNYKYIKHNNIQNLKNSSTHTPGLFLNNKSNLAMNSYKTTNNSPNKLLGKENLKSLKIFNVKINKNNISKGNNKINQLKTKISINNNKKQNTNSKNIIIIKKIKENVLIEEIFKKKLAKKNRKFITSKNSVNNSINLNNTSSKNIQINSSDVIIPCLKYSNFQNENKFQKRKSKLNDIEEDNKEKNINKDILNYTNFKSNKKILNNINSCRESIKIDFKNDNLLKDKKSNIHGNTKKNFYMIQNYISSALSNQPKRHQNFTTKKFNTITNKKFLYKSENNMNCFSSNRKLNNIKNDVNNKSKIQKRYIFRGECKIYVKPNLNLKNFAKTSHTTRHNSRKGSIEKNLNSKNKQLKDKKQGQPIRLSSENNINGKNQKNTYKSISTNNYSNQNSEFISKSNIINKKIDIDYHFVFNNYIINNNNKKGLQNDNKTKKLVYSTRSSKEKMNQKVIWNKKNYINKLFKNIKSNNLNFRTHNHTKEEKKFQRNLSYKFKTPRLSYKIDLKKSGIYGQGIKSKYTAKNTPTKNNIINFTNSKIDSNNRLNKQLGSNTKIEIFKKNSFTKSNELLIKDNKTKNKKMKNEEKKDKTKKTYKDMYIKQNKEKDNKKSDNKEEKNKIKIFDKDLSDKEEDITLLNYLNNNTDTFTITTNKLNDSNDSIYSVSKDNNKYLTYNKSKEIISNYIKQYYLKHKVYPKTKMKFYKYGRLLGKGAYGKVNLCLHTLTGRLVAIKSINKSKITKERHKQKIKIETAIMKALSDSDNIVKIYETYETKKHICIVMEYICAGDLLSYIKKRSKLTESVSKYIFKQIILALKYIHSHNIIHRDIKLDNILIDLDNNIKICDFGVSKIIKKGDIMVEQCGTPAYIAPEILKNKGYEGFGVDIWSAGVVLYAMLSGTVPFKGGDLKDLHKLIIEGQYKSIKNISNEAKHLIKCLLEVEPKNRIKIDDILVHPWLIDVDLNFFKTQNLFTNAEYILLAKSNVDYTEIDNKDNMDENFDIKNLDTEEENLNLNIKTKSTILAPFNSSIDAEEEEESDSNEDQQNDFNNSDLIIRNGIIKFTPKARDLNRNYELNNNQEIDNGIIILSYDSDEKVKKDKSPYDRSYNSKIQSKQFSPAREMENNNKNNDNKNEENENNNDLNEKILEKIKNLGYSKEYITKCINNKEFNYATATYKLLKKFFGES